MPKKLERALMASARRRGLRPGTAHYKRYVYGSLAKIKKRGKKDVA